MCRYRSVVASNTDDGDAPLVDSERRFLDGFALALGTAARAVEQVVEVVEATVPAGRRRDQQLLVGVFERLSDVLDVANGGARFDLELARDGSGGHRLGSEAVGDALAGRLTRLRLTHTTGS